MASHTSFGNGEDLLLDWDPKIQWWMLRDSTATWKSITNTSISLISLPGTLYMQVLSGVCGRFLSSVSLVYSWVDRRNLNRMSSQL